MIPKITLIVQFIILCNCSLSEVSGKKKESREEGSTIHEGIPYAKKMSNLILHRNLTKHNISKQSPKVDSVEHGSGMDHSIQTHKDNYSSRQRTEGGLNKKDNQEEETPTHGKNGLKNFNGLGYSTVGASISQKSKEGQLEKV